MKIVEMVTDKDIEAFGYDMSDNLDTEYLTKTNSGVVDKETSIEEVIDDIVSPAPSDEEGTCNKRRVFEGFALFLSLKAL
ncbi:hypothetical protein TL16_g09837 [Triparma laevis f. inornata]|uniref:Uncharacterized protein n=2 Tax=Triparma laevis TaxID=1534972 RepID=A0A9W7C1Y1_9STRA|nr:hypothetical protein TL16_g09837 [Triparma laevis f. inornata]GMI01220.1 hypothetical protein TrLO_g9512 [Triparma laevis f. longispina]